MWLIVAIVFYATKTSYVNAGETAEKPRLITIDTFNEIEPLPARDRYGYVKVEHDYEEHLVKRNESLYIILRRYDISPQQIYRIQQESKGIANLSRLIPGQRYRIYFKDGKPVSFVWHSELTRYITVDWRNGLEIE